MHSSYYYLPHSFNSFSLPSTSQFYGTVSLPHSHLSLFFVTLSVHPESSLWPTVWNYPLECYSGLTSGIIPKHWSIVRSTSGRDRVPWNPPRVWLTVGRPILIQVKFRKLQLLWVHDFNDCVMARNSIDTLLPAVYHLDLTFILSPLLWCSSSLERFTINVLVRTEHLIKQAFYR